MIRFVIKKSILTYVSICPDKISQDKSERAVKTKAFVIHCNELIYLLCPRHSWSTSCWCLWVSNALHWCIGHCIGVLDILNWYWNLLNSMATQLAEFTQLACHIRQCVSSLVTSFQALFVRRRIGRELVGVSPSATHLRTCWNPLGELVGSYKISTLAFWNSHRLVRCALEV